MGLRVSESLHPEDSIWALRPHRQPKIGPWGGGGGGEFRVSGI